MKTRNRAAYGASLALLLALTACNATGQEGESGPSSDGAPTSASASSPAAEPSPEETEEGSSPATASESSPSDEDEAYEPGFGMVTGEQPASEEEGKEKAEEVLKRYYQATSGLMRHRGAGAENVLPLFTRDPQLGEDRDLFKQIQEEMTGTYEGESKVEVLEAVTGHSRNSDGALLEHSSISLTVCEDNSGVKVTDENGDPVSTGEKQRYKTEYLVSWTPEDQAWKVKTRWDGKEAEAC